MDFRVADLTVSGCVDIFRIGVMPRRLTEFSKVALSRVVAQFSRWGRPESQIETPGVTGRQGDLHQSVLVCLQCNVLATQLSVPTAEEIMRQGDVSCLMGLDHTGKPPEIALEVADHNAGGRTRRLRRSVGEFRAGALGHEFVCEIGRKELGFNDFSCVFHGRERCSSITLSVANGEPPG